MHGLFIVFEGIDGVGKTTQVKMLEEWLLQNGREVVVTHEPGGTDLGKKIRELLLHTEANVDPKAEALLYAADRAQHISQVVRPSLAHGKCVIQDRYIYSSLAYQGAGRVLETDTVEQISLWAANNLWPDITFVLDLPIEEAQERRSGRSADRLEREAEKFHQTVRDGFLTLAQSTRAKTVVIDASLSETEIASIAQKHVSDLI